MLSEREMMKRVSQGLVSLPPLVFRLENLASRRTRGGGGALVSAWWQGRRVGRFTVECLASSTPKALLAARRELEPRRAEGSCNPLLLVPYLSEEKLAELEVARLSAVDLCGNGAVYIDGVLTVYRTGRRNLFPASAPIKNVYRRNSSLVPRVLLSCPRFAAVQEVWREINARNPMVQCQSRTPMSLATVSKVLKSLEEDLTVDRSEGIRLLQPARLLDRLSANYEPPAIRSRRAFKLDESPEAIAASLAREAAALALPVQATGLSSVNRFAVMQRSELMSVYCPEPDALAARLNARETDRFPNLELLETEDERVYFDGEEDGEFRWASALQVWLELMTGDKRDRETADQVREVLLGRTPEGAP